MQDVAISADGYNFCDSASYAQGSKLAIIT